jgi:hypothetical protein
LTNIGSGFYVKLTFSSCYMRGLVSIKL